MSKSKSTGGKARQGSRRSGKRLGIKLYAGQPAKVGSILVRQRGTKFQAGQNVRQGRDYSLYAIKEGLVEFRQKLGKKIIDVISK